MREIKFNFWDSKNNIMYKNPAQLALCSTGGVSELVGHDDYLEWKGTERTKHIIPLQYTGLKDKNSVGIYEGDIIRNTQQNLEKVVFNRGCFKVASISYPNADLYLLDSYCDWTEVIGNIYENPELLEEECHGKR